MEILMLSSLPDAECCGLSNVSSVNSGHLKLLSSNVITNLSLVFLFFPLSLHFTLYVLFLFTPASCSVSNSFHEGRNLLSLQWTCIMANLHYEALLPKNDRFTAVPSCASTERNFSGKKVLHTVFIHKSLTLLFSFSAAGQTTRNNSNKHLLLKRQSDSGRYILDFST